jgi:hypothetical protein
VAAGFFGGDASPEAARCGAAAGGSVPSGVSASVGPLRRPSPTGGRAGETSLGPLGRVPAGSAAGAAGPAVSAGAAGAAAALDLGVNAAGAAGAKAGAGVGVGVGVGVGAGAGGVGGIGGWGGGAAPGRLPPWAAAARARASAASSATVGGLRGGGGSAAGRPVATPPGTAPGGPAVPWGVADGPNTGGRALPMAALNPLRSTVPRVAGTSGGGVVAVCANTATDPLAAASANANKASAPDTRRWGVLWAVGRWVAYWRMARAVPFGPLVSAYRSLGRRVERSIVPWAHRSGARRADGAACRPRAAQGRVVAGRS